MGRSRVLSFISTFGNPKNNDSQKENRKEKRKSSSNVTPAQTPPRWQTPSPDTPSPPSELSPVNGSTPRGEGIGSRPASMIFSRNPPLVAQTEDTPPELSPIFTYLNIHTNKVYQEGYFLKLNDQDNHGRPSLDRQWMECYAQLVGTVLSLWEASALDAADGADVPATFINLADASIKMIETLPIRNGAVQPLKNVLSLSSAGKNRYLLHFNSFHSMTQWTAAIRLAMYEHTSLYEAYTGSLIAAKGKTLPGIQAILAPSKFRHEDWARVRFGAGTPWRRCWFVINPPDEKEIQKARKAMKKSAYDRLSIPITGSISFYETKKTKKVTPIATVTHVYSAYAIYPQSKALIDQSTLVKMEGLVTLHAERQTAEGMVFVMPELHAAVSGLEMMLRFLFPTFDTFNLYGRPTRLVADTNHIKSIMFAFPKERRYGYLDVLDIVNLLQIPGSLSWNEAQWRRQLKEATQSRMSTGRSRTNSVNSTRPRYRASISGRTSDTPTDPSRRPFQSPESKPEFNHSTDAVIQKPPTIGEPMGFHSRGMSDITGFQTERRPGHDSMLDSSPDSSAQDLVQRDRAQALAGPITEHTDFEGERHPEETRHANRFEEPAPRTPPSPVTTPPDFSHGPRSMPTNRPEATYAQTRENNRMSHATLSQLTSVGAMSTVGGVAAALRNQDSDSSIGTRRQAQATSHPLPEPPIPSESTRLAHYSSDEGLGLALPVRQPQVAEQPRNLEQRPATAGSDSTSSPQHNPQIDSAKSVRRKPLPQRQIFGAPRSSQDPGEPSFDDLRHTLDEDALNRIAPHLPSPISPTFTQDESVYDDASAVTPDYASTHESVYSKKSAKSTKPRMGVMKTVGQPTRQDLVIGDAHYTPDKPSEPSFDIPTVDFGPTMTYMPTTGRPNTGDTLRKASNQTDAERYRISVPTNPMGHERSPSQEDHRRRSVLWQPGMASGRPTTPGGGLTPEHHHRSGSSSNTPPLQRPVSGDWTQQARPNSRMTSYQDPNYRPSSRGASTMMGYGDVANHLSAREQEHVARMTGSSFFDMSSNNQKPQPSAGGGLVSSIDAREREKRAMKEGMSNHMVQHAIASRNQQMMQQPFQQQQQQFTPQQYASQYAGSLYHPQAQAPIRQEGMYNMPAASQTWDALHQVNQASEPRRQSWYGQLNQALPTPPSYQQSQNHVPQGSNYYSGVNTMHH
ncbi:hypothetical protein N7533_002208 [Penicillium manginii]|uniref:uncharacterized protein n=1 Tax=Penicillium manginii TaxID=203109 RepID=UPI0025481BE7|nr:uncharacterized protein N7533_002208 [Penicillium manginii]KAJ5763527.1 hypothetical protein N7533_002208 [Penicillium manginii]